MKSRVAKTYQGTTRLFQLKVNGGFCHPQLAITYRSHHCANKYSITLIHANQTLVPVISASHQNFVSKILERTVRTDCCTTVLVSSSADDKSFQHRIRHSHELNNSPESTLPYSSNNSLCKHPKKNSVSIDVNCGWQRMNQNAGPEWKYAKSRLVKTVHMAPAQHTAQCLM